MNGKLAGKSVALFVASAAERGIEGLVVVANAVVAQHQVNRLAGADGKVTAECRLRVEAISHLDLVGAESDVCSEIDGKEGRHFRPGEIGFQAAKDLDVVANIIAGAVIGVTRSAVVLVAV